MSKLKGVGKRVVNSRLAELLAECPYLYTTDDYGMVVPKGFEAARWYESAAEWLAVRGIGL